MDELDAVIDRLQGTPESKRRLKIVLRSIVGQILDKEACRELGVSQSGLERLRRDAMRGMWNGVCSMPDDRAEN